ncbi:hypothetical protein IGK74_002289 [Enterococcus sp. AZ150]|uniref:hypothetical protein n=1 Tax=Enterococcus sp. AZ150 TaxID=2774866 RepID=UPI003F27382E
MIQYESTETIQGNHKGKYLDFDRYNLLEKTTLSTKEISICIDFSINKNEPNISGDIIAYGEWTYI